MSKNCPSQFGTRDRPFPPLQHNARNPPFHTPQLAEARDSSCSTANSGFCSSSSTTAASTHFLPPLLLLPYGWVRGAMQPAPRSLQEEGGGASQRKLLRSKALYFPSSSSNPAALLSLSLFQRKKTVCGKGGGAPRKYGRRRPSSLFTNKKNSPDFFSKCRKCKCHKAHQGSVMPATPASPRPSLPPDLNRAPISNDLLPMKKK